MPTAHRKYAGDLFVNTIISSVTNDGDIAVSLCAQFLTELNAFKTKDTARI